ncbi:MAG: hypothetical protein WCB79_04150 [Halobacteriota archaeon]|jgi:hypothetical protein
MRRELWTAYRTVENRAQALVTRAIHYYTKDTPLNTLAVYAAIKIIVLLGAILVSLQYQPSALFQNPVFLASWDGRGYQGIAYQGYAFNYPNSAAFPPMYPLLIKIFSLNQPTLRN